MIRIFLLLAFCAFSATACINPASTDCSRGLFFGGAAGTDLCPADSAAYVHNDPRYGLGLSFTTVDPNTGATVIVPGSAFRAQTSLQPVLEGAHRAIQRNRQLDGGHDHAR